MGRKPRLRAKPIIARDRELKALELRRQGLTYASMAVTMGISEAGARKATARALAVTLEDMREGAAELRALELERLDAMHAALWPRALEGDVQAIGVVLRLSERRCRLLGLDMPVRADVVVAEVRDPHEHLARLLAGIRARIEAADDSPVRELG